MVKSIANLRRYDILTQTNTTIWGYAYRVNVFSELWSHRIENAIYMVIVEPFNKIWRFEIILRLLQINRVLK